MLLKVTTFLIFMMANVVVGQQLDSLKNHVVEDFSKVFKNEHFSIEDEVTTKYISEDEVYFVVKIIPKKEGTYFIKQIFEYEKDWGYKNNSILNIIKVAKKGTVRHFSSMEPNPLHSSTCSVGDTIMIPLFWNKHIISTKFSKGNQLEQDIYGKIDSVFTVKNLERQLDWKVKNNVSEVNVEEVTSTYSIHRGLKNESVYHSIHFTALKKGSFILKVGETKHNLIIYPAKATISKVVTHVVGTQWEDKVTSHGLPHNYNKQHFVSSMKLRVGDTFVISFLGYVQNVNTPKEVNTTITIAKTVVKEEK